MKTKESGILAKIAKYVLVPTTFFWVVIDTLFIVFANYYFNNVVFGPLLHFTPTQTFVAIFLFAFLVYVIYQSLKNRRK